MEYQQFKKGDKVKSVFGAHYVVLSQEDCVVYFTNGDRAHPAKIWKI